MSTERTSIGLDVHARSITAAAIDDVTGDLVQTKLTPSYEHVQTWLGQLPGPVAVAYEAGPTGFGLHGRLTALGVRCEVVAPSKLERPKGDRVKPDVSDAVRLARLLRHGVVYYDGDAWTGKHDAWLRRQRFDNQVTQATFESDYDAVLTTTARRDRLDGQIPALAADSEFTPMVRRLGCLRGVSTLTAFALAVEIGDWERFTGSSIGAFIGLVPSEHSSGNSRTLGPITKTGNGHVRRLLVEATWHHRRRYVVGRTMRERWELASPAARARGDLGNRRLHARWVKFIERKKKNTIVNTAIARELAGWCWSLAVLEE